jgi:lipoprotein LprG
MSTQTSTQSSTPASWPARRRRRGIRPAAALVVALGLMVLQGCSDDSGGGDSGDAEEALDSAKQQLDETPGIELELTTEKLPDGVEGILSAIGTATHAPAFDGDLKVQVDSLTAEVPVVSVDGAVYATLPFSDKFVEIDPSDYAAPDPADLMAPDGGISSWLTAVTEVQAGDEVRSGEQVLTTYSGKLPGEAVSAVIPSASADGEFDVDFRLDDEDRLVDAVIEGPFYGDAGDVTYDLELSAYGTDKDITAPTGQ